jgi:hypothetical protein
MSNELPDSHPNNGHPQPQGLTKPLAARQQRFVEEYLLDLNGSQAAIRAGYSEQTATMQASRMLTNANIARAIAAAQAKVAQRLDCDVERVMAELASIAFNVEERTQDRIRALELLAKHGGAFVERSEIKVQAHKAIDAPPACATYEEWLGRQHMRTEGERMREFAAYVRMMGVQRGAMHSTVEDSADDIDEMCDQAGVPRRTGEPSTD